MSTNTRALCAVRYRLKGRSAPALKGVNVAETRLSEVDGERGRLIIAGHDVEQLAGQVSFAALFSLLWEGRFPESTAIAATEAALGQARVQAAAMAYCHAALRLPDAMDACGRHSPAHRGPAPGDSGREVHESLMLIGAMPVYAAAWFRAQSGQTAILPDPHLQPRRRLPAHADRRDAEPARAAALDAYLVRSATTA